MDGERPLTSFALAALLGVLVFSAPVAAQDRPAAAPARVLTGDRVVESSRAPVALAQEFPSPPLYQLLPHDYPYPLIRLCYTYAGICLIPFTIQPGTPCECVASNGVRVSGVCTK